MRSSLAVMAGLLCVCGIAGLATAPRVAAEEMLLAQGGITRLTAVRGGATPSIFLRLEGIRGGSKDAAHADWVDVTDWGFGAEAQIDPTSVRAMGVPVVSGLVVRKPVDRSSPKLFELCVSNAIISSGELEVPIGAETLRVQFTRGRVTSVGRDIDSGDPITHERLAIIAEEYVLRFESPDGIVEVTYRGHREP